MRSAVDVRLSVKRFPSLYGLAMRPNRASADAAAVDAEVYIRSNPTTDADSPSIGTGFDGGICQTHNQRLNTQPTTQTVRTERPNHACG
jgi:hypothetical protein